MEGQVQPTQCCCFGCSCSLTDDAGCRLVAQMSLFPGMQHLDVAGGTGDVAFRLAASLQPIEAHAAATYTDLETPRQPVRCPLSCTPGTRPS